MSNSNWKKNTGGFWSFTRPQSRDNRSWGQQSKCPHLAGISGKRLWHDLTLMVFTLKGKQTVMLCLKSKMNTPSCLGPFCTKEAKSDCHHMRVQYQLPKVSVNFYNPLKDYRNIQWFPRVIVITCTVYNVIPRTSIA